MKVLITLADVEPAVLDHPHQLLSVDDVPKRARRVESTQGDRAADREVMTQHRSERHEARPAADEQ